MKVKPIYPNPQDVAFLRKKMMNLIRRMQSDYERELKPLIKRMTKEAREEAAEAMEEGQKVLAKDSVQYLTAYEAAMQLHILKSDVVRACQIGEIQGAIQTDGEWLIPEDSVYDYGVQIGKIDPDATLMDRFNERLKRLNQKYDDLLSSYENMSREFTKKMFKDAKRKFIKQFGKTVGVDILKSLGERGLKEAFEAQVAENVGLIKSIPSKYFEKIQEMVIASTLGQQRFEGGIVKEIQELTHTTRKRAKLIARDQSAKAVSTFTQMRYQNLGCTKYIWRNAQDRRVAGNPNGLYPDPDPKSKYHGNHWDREGKVYEWTNPPPDGNPGMPINCRCYAEPIFDIEEEVV